MGVEDRKFFYNSVLSQTFSSCGNYLFAGNNFGDIFVFSIQQIFSISDETTDHKKQIPAQLLEPVQIFKASEKSQVQSLSFFKNFLIVGTSGEISGYNWSEENRKIIDKVWQVDIPSQDSFETAADINSLWLQPESCNLFAGCGDNNIYGLSLDNGKIFRSYSGHKDYIHCVHGCGNRLYSASEDGFINIWDYRQKKIAGKIEPYKNDSVNRPEYGKWQGTVAATDDWLLCGGGPKPSLWHLRSMECTTIYPFPEKVHVSGFIEDTILVAGDYNHLYEYTLNGDITAEIPVSSSSIYSTIWQTEPTKIMSIGGASNKIDICVNFNYKDIVLKLYKNNHSSRC